MPTEDGDTSGPTGLSHEGVLDELDFLATVEHALCVEYLSIHSALGHDLDPADAGEAAAHVAQAARSASAAAFAEMRHLHDVNQALVRAGRAPQLGRAVSISASSGSEIALGPLSLQQLERLLERERELAAAVDERYARLRHAVESSVPMLEGEVLSAITSLLDPEPDHSRLPAALQKELERIPPSQYLRATPREPRDDLERSLLDLSDHLYRLVRGILRIWFDHEDDLFGARSQAVDTMNGLDMVNRLLVERGLLPAFTPPAT